MKYQSDGNWQPGLRPEILKIIAGSIVKKASMIGLRGSKGNPLIGRVQSVLLWT
jgi:hypothetical protein